MNQQKNEKEKQVTNRKCMKFVVVILLIVLLLSMFALPYVGLSKKRQELLEQQASTKALQEDCKSAFNIMQEEEEQEKESNEILTILQEEHERLEEEKAELENQIKNLREKIK